MKLQKLGVISIFMLPKCKKVKFGSVKVEKAKSLVYNVT